MWFAYLVPGSASFSLYILFSEGKDSALSLSAVKAKIVKKFSLNVHVFVIVFVFVMRGRDD